MAEIPEEAVEAVRADRDRREQDGGDRQSATGKHRRGRDITADLQAAYPAIRSQVLQELSGKGSISEALYQMVREDGARELRKRLLSEETLSRLHEAAHHGPFPGNSIASVIRNLFDSTSNQGTQGGE